MKKLSVGDKIKLRYWSGTPMDISFNQIYIITKRSVGLGFIDSAGDFRDISYANGTYIIINSEVDTYGIVKFMQKVNKGAYTQ
jgi:hypothetical protein